MGKNHSLPLKIKLSITKANLFPASKPPSDYHGNINLKVIVMNSEEKFFFEITKTLEFFYSAFSIGNDKKSLTMSPSDKNLEIEVVFSIWKDENWLQISSFKQTRLIQNSSPRRLQIDFQKNQFIHLQIEPETDIIPKESKTSKENYDIHITFSNYFDPFKKKTFYFVETENLQSIFKLFLLFGGVNLGKTHFINIFSGETFLNSDIVKGTPYPSLVIIKNGHAFLDMKGNNCVPSFFGEKEYELLEINNINGIFTKEFEEEKEKKILEQKVTKHFLRTVFLEKAPLLIIFVGILKLEEQLALKKIHKKFPNLKKIVIHNFYQLKDQKEILVCIEHDIRLAFNTEKYLFGDSDWDQNCYQYYHKENNNCLHFILANSSIPDLDKFFNAPVMKFLKSYLSNISDQNSITISEFKQNFIKKIDEELLTYVHKKQKKSSVKMNFKKSRSKKNSEKYEICSLKNLNLNNFEIPKCFAESYDGDVILGLENNQTEKFRLEYLVYVEKNQNLNNSFETAPFLLKVQIFCNRGFEHFYFHKPSIQYVLNGKQRLKYLAILINKVLKKKTFFHGTQPKLFSSPMMEIKIMESNNLFSLHFEEIFYNFSKQFDEAKNCLKDEKNKIYTYIIPFDGIIEKDQDSLKNENQRFESKIEEKAGFDLVLRKFNQEEQVNLLYYWNEIPATIRLNYSFEFNPEEDEIERLSYRSLCPQVIFNPLKKYKMVSLIGTPLKSLLLTNLFDIKNERQADYILTFLNEMNTLLIVLEGITKPLLMNQELSKKAFANWDLKNKLTQDFAVQFSDLLIFCVIGLSEVDQENIYKVFDSLRYTEKNIVILHYFLNFSSPMDIDTSINQNLKKCFLVRESLFDVTVYDTSRYNIVYYTNIFPKNQGYDKLKVMHLIMAENGTEAGRYYNPSTILFLRDKINLLIPKEKNVFIEFEKFLKSSMEKKFLLSFEESFDFTEKNKFNFLKVLKIIPKNLTLANIQFASESFINFDPQYELILLKSKNMRKLQIFLPLNENYYEIKCSRGELAKNLIVSGTKLKYEPLTKIVPKYVIENTLHCGAFQKSIQIIEGMNKMSNFIMQKIEWTTDCYEILLELVE